MMSGSIEDADCQNQHNRQWRMQKQGGGTPICFGMKVYNKPLFSISATQTYLVKVVAAEAGHGEEDRSGRPIVISM